MRGEKTKVKKAVNEAEWSVENAVDVAGRSAKKVVNVAEKSVKNAVDVAKKSAKKVVTTVKNQF